MFVSSSDVFMSVAEGGLEGASSGRGAAKDHLPESCQGTRIMRIRTEAERNVFERITFANLTVDGAAASLWESYQVSHSLGKRLLKVGRWTTAPRCADAPRDEADEGNPMSGSSTPTSHAAALLSIPKEVGTAQMTMDFGVLLAPVDDPLQRRQDLTGLHLTCTTIDYDPMIVLEEGPGGSVLVGGLVGKFFLTLKEITNFTYTCRRVRDGEWGSAIEGRWTGMIGEVSDGMAQVAIAPLSVTQKRSAVVGFLIPLIVTSSRIILKRPTNEDYMWTVYTKQFTPGVWGMLVAAVFSLGLFLACVSRYAHSEVSVPPIDSVLTVVGFMFGQGTVLRVETVAGRTLVLTALLLQVVTLSYYTSNLVSALTVGPPLPPYRDLRDIHQEKSITFGLLKGTAESDALKDSDLPLYKAVWRDMKEDHLVMTSTEGMNRVFRGDYAFLEWEIFYLLNYGTDCRAIMLPFSFLTSFATFAISRDSPLIPIFNKLILDMLSAGFFKKWWMEMNVNNNVCAALETAPIELRTIVTPFIVLGLGVLVALGVLAAEFFFIRRG
ncbi:probable glutamate receptor isoform X2 [Penaeus chinensis]|uniref:probable glutamate receptor isoform X2 n=1 Tax=Penaeus chinensis TaxID=139456 RepID=UPI001FB6FD9D|nr:probable glutamate receptor isoform X2 [Penaeus chinensis]